MVPEKETDTSKDQPTSGRSDRFFALMMLLGSSICIAGFGLLFSMWWQSEITADYDVLRVASQEYVAGHPIIAGDLAASVNLDRPEQDHNEGESAEDARPLRPEEQAAEAERQRWNRLRNFLVGAGKVARATESEDRLQRRRFYYEAIPYLKHCQENGFPAGREAQGNQLLGETLNEVGRFSEAGNAFGLAIEHDPLLERELLPKLARAQLESLQPTSQQSLETIDRFLADPTLNHAQRREGQLIRIRALIDLKRWQEAWNQIASLLQRPPETDINLVQEDAEFREQLRLQRGIVGVEQAIARFGSGPKDLYEDRTAAVAFLAPTLEQLSDLQREAAPQIAARARLWTARAYLVQGMQEAALTELTAVQNQRPFGAVGVIGSLEKIEVLADQGRGEEMLQTTQYVMQEVGDEKGFDATLIAFEEFRRRLREAIEQLRTHGKYEHAIDAARSLPPVFARSEALMQEGMGFQQWAAATIAGGTDLGGEVANSAAVLARQRYRAAGDAFAEAAEILFKTPQYVPTLWSAIDAYQQGRHFTRSLELLEPYLRYEDRRRQPRGLVAYGEALLAVGQPREATEALADCIIEFPRDPLRYDARLLSALAHAELGELDRAEDFLKQNLQDGELTPSSPAWRDSLLTLGEMLYQRGYENHLHAQRASGPEKLQLLRDNQPVLEEAIRRLDEAVVRYWEYPRGKSALYLASRSHTFAAEFPRMEAKSPEILDAAKRSLQAQTKNEFEAALEGFRQLGDHLSLREEERRLPPNQQSMLRNCLLSEADTLRQMNQLEDAAAAYRAVSLRFMNEPPALEALLGEARCAKGLGRNRESDLLIRQASVILQRIPSEWDDRFEETTRFDRRGWERLLTWMNNRLDNTTGGVG